MKPSAFVGNTRQHIGVSIGDNNLNLSSKVNFRDLQSFINNRSPKLNVASSARLNLPNFEGEAGIDSVSNFTKAKVGNDRLNLYGIKDSYTNKYNPTTKSVVGVNYKPTPNVTINPYQQKIKGNNWEDVSNNLGFDYRVNSDWNVNGKVSDRDGNKAYNIGINGRF